MPWLVDGNNVARGGGRARVREAALALARAERLRVVVVFDGAPPAGSPVRESLGTVEVRYEPNADRAILELLSPRGAGWRLASDDRELGRRAKELGAEIVPARAFWAKVGAADLGAGGSSPRVEIERELAYFRDPSARLPAPASRVPRRRRR